MIISTGKSRKDMNWKPEELSWKQLADRLRTPKRTAETCAEYRAMSRDEKGAVKDVGGFVGGRLTDARRRAGNVADRCLITLDLDRAAQDAWDGVVIQGWTACCYSTHSHTSAEPRLRVVMPLDRLVTPDEYEAIARQVAYWIGIAQVDASSYEPSRLMYWPSCSSDGEFYFRECEGEPVEAAEVLSAYGPGDAWKNSALWPVGANETAKVRHEEKRQGDPVGKPGMVGLFCRSYDVRAAISAFLPDVCTEGESGRYTYAAGSSSNGAVVYEDGAFLYSHHGTDPAGGQLLNAFDLVRIHRFGDLDADCGADTPVTKLPSYLAMCEFASEDDTIKEQIVEERQRDAEEKFSDILVPDSDEDAEKSGEQEGEQEQEDNDWKHRLHVDKKTGRPEPDLNNAILLLEHLPAFRGKLGYNPMADQITVRGELPWWQKQRIGRLEDVLGEKSGETGVSVWGEKDYPSFYAYFEGLGFPTKGQRNGVLDNALQVVSSNNPYHPIRSYLLGLRWDGAERLDTMFVRWLGAEDTPLDREITRLWMIAGVDRVMRPGCQFDSILITVGDQGIGKSRLLRLLSKGYYTNSLDKLDVGKDTAEKLQGVWIVEIGELDKMKRGELTEIKNFVTTTKDRFRGAYARGNAVDHPRQCVLAGTSNEGSFLRDGTGERRFWIMPVRGTGDHGELIGFREEVDQLWAEAVHLWRERMARYGATGKHWNDVDLYLYLREPALQRAMEERQGVFKLPDDDRDEVEAYLDRPRPANWYDLDADARRDYIQGSWIGEEPKDSILIDHVSVKEIRYELFGETIHDTGRATSRSYRIASILDTMPGWEKGKIQKGDKAYGRIAMRVWERVGSGAEMAEKSP